MLIGAKDATVTGLTLSDEMDREVGTFVSLNGRTYSLLLISHTL